MIEVELKCALPAQVFPMLQEKLQQLSYVRTVHNIDRYYDTPDFALLQQSAFVRVRNARTLEFKMDSSGAEAHVQALERAFPLVPDSTQATGMNMLFASLLPQWQTATTVEAALATNGLIELARIDNQRKEYRDEELIVSLDHVEALGDFLEVEMQCIEGSDTSAALAHLRAFAASLGMQEIPTGYVELWLRIHKPEAYQVVRYKV